MGVDWPLVFQGAKTVLDPLASASWPIVIGLTAWAFRKPIESMIGRVRQFSGFGTTAEFATREAITHQQEAKNTSNPVLPAIADASKFPPADPVFDILDRQLRSLLDQVISEDDALKLAWAIRQRSISEANRIHETNYRLIFGSQIFALKTLNTVGQGLVSEFENYYNEKVLVNSQWEGIHKGRNFEQWGQFLLDAEYVVIVEGSDPPIVQITSFGKQFLHWMVLAGVSEFKVG
ncbi:MAG: hypothetical protein B7Y87_01280 [Sphingomonadales bacterium 32-64-22]|nr:MAG: hypothetical protein B7Y87_01280 [Sphingomonadales bacterium 32-64-22]